MAAMQHTMMKAPPLSSCCHPTVVVDGRKTQHFFEHSKSVDHLVVSDIQARSLGAIANALRAGAFVHAFVQDLLLHL